MYLNDFSLVFAIIFVLGWYFLQSFAYYKFFEKAGKAGWIGFVPFYNYYTHIELVGRPKWWIILLIVPVVNFFVALTIHLDLYKSFGKFTYVHQVLGCILWPIYTFYIALTATEYKGKATDIPKEKKALPQEWMEAIVFAVFAATFIRWIFMEAYVIPTSSMESNLLVGDFLFVSKAEYGPRTPKTVLQIPLTHAKIWGTDKPSYSRLIELPHLRLPSFGTVERNDVVVFNYPFNDHYNARPDGDFHPMDLKTHYVKRCVAIPGDVLEIKASQVYINGEIGENPEILQHNYRIVSKQTLPERFFVDHKIREPQKLNGNTYYAPLSEQQVEKLKGFDFITDVVKDERVEGQAEQGIFPKKVGFFDWNRDFFGPLEIPYRGMEITVDSVNLAKYGYAIEYYEGLDNVEVKADELVINGESVDTYVMTRDYYFMMGDNRHRSDDSRYWGFVPEDNIVGEASFIWMSYETNETGLSKIRWNRLLKAIE
ncbi:MAG: signal peptidase I [Cyclobacteriaceae bacterium]